jgi:hypothetical protein
MVVEIHVASPRESGPWALSVGEQNAQKASMARFARPYWLEIPAAFRWRFVREDSSNSQEHLKLQENENG